ncbi:MAG: glycosyltransferase [Thermoanaerobaculia bacterium]|jgi:glycosyltransferase involved in cell wall biosynthesis
MRVARLLLATRSHFDLKCFRLDSAGSQAPTEDRWCLPGRSEPGLEARSEGEIARALRSSAPQLLHVYGSGTVPHQLLSATGGAPWLADRSLGASRPFFGHRPRAQARILAERIAEPVADEYFAPRPPRAASARRRVGSQRQSSRSESARDLADARIRRFRDDIDWFLFDTPPTADEMATLDLWVDLADEETDLDGMVGEALALGLPLVATRTAANRRRTADGRAAALCPSRDPNEMAHAIVTMLFKPERATPILTAAAEVRDQFRAETRREALRLAYAEVIG